MTSTATEATAPRTKGCCLALPGLLGEDDSAELAAVFRTLADPTRVQMLHLLKTASAPICVCDFTAAFDLGQPTVSHHLARLREAGFVTSFKAGIWAFYSLREDMPAAARRALELVP